MRYNFFETPYM